MPKLYPPNIEGTIPAFYTEKGDKQRTILSVPFSMNKAVVQSEVSTIVLKLKTIQSGSFLFTIYANPEDISYDPQGIVNFDITEFAADYSETKKLNVNQFYKIQIAYVDKNNVTGYYSTVGVVKYTTKPEVTIQNLEHGRVNMHTYDYTGVYSQKDKDTSEKAYSYCFNLYDKTGALLQTSGEIVHNNQNDTEFYESVDSYSIPQDLETNKSYYLEYIVTTINKLVVKSPKYRLMQKKSIDPEIKADLVVTTNYENGYNNINLIGHKNSEGLEYAATGAFKIMRSSNEDNYGAWYEVLRFALYGQQPSRWMWRDMTAKQGYTYKYALQQYNDYNLHSNRLEGNEVYVDFEHAFLFDGERQLKIKYNPKVTSFKNVIMESKVDTIGSKHPFIFRNGNVKYKEFPISGLISCQLDDEFLFVNEDFLAEYENNINLTNKNIKTEREFKLEVLEWLNNGKPKLFRSPAEGNYIVRLLNVSMTPNDALGRMLHTFTATAYEIAEHNYENLIKYGLINAGDPTYEQLRWETINLDQSSVGDYGPEGDYEIPNPSRNILKGHYPAVSLHFEGMVPGDRLWIDDGIERDGLKTPLGTTISSGFGITIGVTGSYIIDLDIGTTVKGIYFDYGADNQEIDNKLVQHQGSLTYAYYSRVQNRFDSITDIQIIDVISEQYIGKHDVIYEIEDSKTKIQDYYYLRAMLREAAYGYKIKDAVGNIKYTMDEEGKYEIQFDPYYFYHITDKINNTKYWYDCVFKEIFDERDTSIYFTKDKKKYSETGFNHDITKGIDLSEIQEYVIRRPKDLQTIVTGNSVILELSYQKQVLNFQIEDKYPDILEAKNNKDKIYNIIQLILDPYAEDENTINSIDLTEYGYINPVPVENENIGYVSAEQILNGTINTGDLYDYMYPKYLEAYAIYEEKLEQGLIAEEEAQGDVIA